MKISIKHKMTINDKVMFVLLGLLFFLGIMVAYNSKHLFEKISVLMIIPFIATACYKVFSGQALYTKNRITTLSFLYCASIFVSSLLQMDISNIVSSILLIAAFYIAYKSPLRCEEKLFRMMNYAMIAAYVASLLYYGNSEFNSQGCIAAIAGIVAINMVDYKKNTGIIIFGVIEALIISMMIIFRSRTSLAAFLIASIFAYIQLVSSKRHRLIKLILVIASSIAIIYFYEDISLFLNNFFFHKWGNSDISSGRYTIWSKIITDISLFGHGRNALGQGVNWNMDAHSAFFQILSCFGIISFIIFLMLFIEIIKRITVCSKRFVYVNFYSAWFVLSLFENMELLMSRYIPITILFIFYTSSLNQESVE